jgi:hypothetical protein
MSFLKRREIPIAICVGSMVYLLFSYYTNIGTGIASDLRSWMTQVSTFAMLIGVVMLFIRHTKIILRRIEGWPYSIIALVSFFLYTVVQYSSKDLYQYVLMNIYTPIGYASATAVVPITIYYTGTRVRSIFSALLVGTLIISNFYNIAIGTVIFGPGLNQIGSWLNDVINTGVMRAITIGMGLGLLTVVIRIIMGMETSYLGEVK